MPRKCSVCTHPDRVAIDEALVGGTAISALSAKYRDISEDALGRHKANHLPAKLVMAQAAEEVAQADTLLGQVQNLQARTLAILGQAEGAGALRTALGAIREARGNLELLGKLAGEIDERPQVNILVAPQVQYVILSALEPYPEARIAVAESLKELDA
jgi:acetylornithine/succinyldiaminopimelate/putrescine aminotransferase